MEVSSWDNYLQEKHLHSFQYDSLAHFCQLLLYFKFISSLIKTADACVESFFDWSDRISGNNFIFYAESITSEENLQYEEPRRPFSFAEKQKSRSEETN